MNESRHNLKAVFAPAADQRYWHIGEEQMIAFYEGEIVAAQRETIAEHLSECAECSRLLRNVGNFLRPMSQNEEPISEAKIAEGWEQLWAQVKKETTAPLILSEKEQPVILSEKEQPGKVIPFPVKKNRPLIPVARLAIAASLFLSVSSTGYLAWRVQQEKQNAEYARREVAKVRDEQQQQALQIESLSQILNQKNERSIVAGNKMGALPNLMGNEKAIAYAPALPQSMIAANSDTLQNIQPEEFFFGYERASGGMSLEFATDVQAKLLVMTVNNPLSFQEYEIELLDESGQLAQSAKKLKPIGDENTLNLLIRRTGLKNGDYRLVRYGLNEQGKQKLDEQELTIKLR